ncbi:MAG: hypothetical protein FWG71_07200, partial [Synergistaceae bacterium]|nr:hypothetical protein [Synergistaceae bacterium]
MRETKTWGKKALVLFLTTMMALTMLPMAAFADADDVVKLPISMDVAPAIAGQKPVWDPLPSPKQGSENEITVISADWFIMFNDTPMISTDVNISFDKRTDYTIKITVSSDIADNVNAISPDLGWLENNRIAGLVDLPNEGGPNRGVVSNNIYLDWVLYDEDNAFQGGTLNFFVDYFALPLKKITPISAEITPPRAGELVDWVVDLTGSTGYGFVSSDWFVNNEVVPRTGNPTFKEVDKYTFGVTLSADFEHEFVFEDFAKASMDIKVGLGGQTGKFTVSDDVFLDGVKVTNATSKDILTFFVNFGPTPINEVPVSVDLADVPKAGEISQKVVIDSTNYELVSSDWATSSDVPLSLGDRFKENTDYELTVKLRGKDNLGFKADIVSTDISGTIKVGVEDIDDVKVSEGGKELTFVVTYPRTGTLTPIEPFTLEIPGPRAGELLEKAVDGDGFVVTSTDWYLDGVEKALGDRFEENKAYDAKITLTADPGLKFPDLKSGDVTINSSGGALGTTSNDILPEPDFGKTITFTVNFQPTDTLGAITSGDVEIELKAPVAGALSTSADVVGAAAKYEVTATKWNDGDSDMDPGEQFGEKKTYTAKITLTADPGSKFEGIANSADISVLAENVVDITAIIRPNELNKILDISVEFEETGDRVKITPIAVNLTAPVAGILSTSADVAEGAAYEVGNTKWFDEDDELLAVGAPFEEETAYYAEIELKVTDTRFKFVHVPPVTSNDITGTVKAGAIEEPITGDAETLAFKVEFPATGDKASIARPITVEMTAPYTGEEPEDAEAAEGREGDYKAVNTGWDPNPALTDGRFVEETVYTATVTLEAVAGKKFPTTVTSLDISVPGGMIEADPSRPDDGTLVFSVVFPETEPVDDIAEVTVTVVAPVAGELVKDADAKVGADENYEVTGTIWALEPSDRFGEGEAYTAAIVLNAKTGYTFAEMAKDDVTLVGDYEEISSVDADGRTLTIFVEFAETDLLNEIEKPYGVNLTAPVAEATAGSATTDGNYSPAVVWIPTPYNNTFEYDVAYTAKITLTANPGYVFEAGVTSADITGSVSTGGAVGVVTNDTVSHKTLAFDVVFPKTGTQTLFPVYLWKDGVRSLLGNYREGETVHIQAPVVEGELFHYWESYPELNFANKYKAETTFPMKGEEVNVGAVYYAIDDFDDIEDDFGVVWQIPAGTKIAAPAGTEIGEDGRIRFFDEFTGEPLDHGILVLLGTNNAVLIEVRIPSGLTIDHEGNITIPLSGGDP